MNCSKIDFSRTPLQSLLEADLWYYEFLFQLII